MMKRLTLGIAALVLVLSDVGQSYADLVYDNGPINGGVEAWTINFGYQVSDSFTLGSPATLTGAQIGLWVIPGDTPTSVDWSIGSAAFGSDISSGTAGLSNVFQYTNVYRLRYLGVNISAERSAGTGTYWLTLQNATSSSGNPVYWDQNSGPSSAQENTLGVIPSESFQVYGAGAVPEPSTICLLGIGMVGPGRLLPASSELGDGVSSRIDPDDGGRVSCPAAIPCRARDGAPLARRTRFVLASGRPRSRPKEVSRSILAVGSRIPSFLRPAVGSARLPFAWGGGLA